MIHLLCSFIGLIIGGLLVYYVKTRSDKEFSMPVDLTGIRWESGNSVINHDAYKYLRRHYPTHDIVTNVSFLELAQAKGSRVEDVIRTCKSWTVGVVMIDKRTGSGQRIILWKEDPQADEKAWILKRIGYRVFILQRDGAEQQIIEGMAA